MHVVSPRKIVYRLGRSLRWRILRPLVTTLDAILNRTVFSPDRVTFRAITRICRLLRAALLFLQKGTLLRVFALNGQDSAGQERRILYVGERESLGWFAKLVFSGGHDEEEREAVRPWQLGRTLREASRSHDLVAFEVNRYLSPTLRRSPRYVIPRWVRVKIPVAPSWDEMRRHMKKSAFKQIRWLRNRDFSYELTRDPAAFEEFHDHMYVPFVKRRHGDEVILHEREELESFFRKGGLLKVIHEGAWKAGVLNVAVGSEVRSVVVGLRDDDPEALQKNVIKAIYYFTIDRTMELGLSAVEVGRVRPVYEDGVFQHKWRWGGVISLDPWEEARLLVYPGMAPTLFEELPLRHPFFEEAGKKLHGRVTLPNPLPDDPKDLEKAIRPFICPGIACLDVTGSDGEKRLIPVEPQVDDHG